MSLMRAEMFAVLLLNTMSIAMCIQQRYQKKVYVVPYPGSTAPCTLKLVANLLISVYSVKPLQIPLRLTAC